MSDPESPDNPAATDPARYRICATCQEPGAAAITHMFLTDSGGAYARYSHPGCAAAAGDPVSGMETAATLEVSR
ncbi:hypothetical protein AB0G73_20455 [Streptomyces sp. NPDC020719]|uniref:hypothetical protein n=1 Tax=unclassified Streptomyces TaxID=2593676 RepID=UPI00340628AF